MRSQNIILLYGMLIFTAAAPVSSSPDASKFTFYDMLTPEVGPCDLCTGPDNAIWGEDILADIIFRIDPETGQVEEFPIPFTIPPLPFSVLPGMGQSTRSALACAIRSGADGNIYASAGTRNQLVRINPTTKEIDVFTPPPYNPAGDLQPFNDLYTDSEGIFFTQTTGNVVTYFEFATQQFTNFPVPTPEGSPLGMFVASDGLAYFAEFLGQKIGRLNRTSGEIDEFSLAPSDLPALAGPAVIRVETDSRYIWFTAFLGNSMGRFDMLTGTFAAFPNTQPLSFPAEDTLSPDGRVWFSTATQDAINYVDSNTGQVVNVVEPETAVLNPVSLPFQFEIAINYFDDAIYFTQAIGNRVGRYQLD